MSLSSVNPAALPAEIRTGSADRRQTYQAAMQFESMLVQQLTKQLTASSSDSGDGDSSPDTSGMSGPYASMLPGAFADGIESGGGLGLAMSLTDAIDPITPSTTSSTSTTETPSSPEQTSAATPTQGATA